MFKGENKKSPPSHRSQKMRLGRFGLRGWGQSVSRVNADLLFFAGHIFKCDHTCYFGKNRIIASETDVGSGVEMSSPLTHQDLTGFHVLSAISFDAKTFAYAVPAV